MKGLLAVTQQASEHFICENCENPQHEDPFFVGILITLVIALDECRQKADVKAPWIAAIGIVQEKKNSLLQSFSQCAQSSSFLTGTF